MSLDGGFAYVAGHCGLVPVLGENYSEWVGLSVSLWAGAQKGDETVPFFFLVK